LMIGIFIEICAAGSAASDDWQTRQIAMRTDALMQDRHISDQQIEIFTNLLKGYARQPVCVFYLSDDRDTYEYAKKIREMLDKSGYNVFGASPAFSRDFGYRFSLKSVPTNTIHQSVFLGIDITNSLPDYIPAVKKSFKEIGVDAPYIIFTQSGFTGDLIVLVRERF
jgi:hypothetical protein